MTKETKQSLIDDIERLSENSEVLLIMDDQKGTFAIDNTSGVDFRKLGYACLMIAHKDKSGRAEESLQKFAEGMAMAIRRLDQKNDKEMSQLLMNFKPIGNPS